MTLSLRNNCFKAGIITSVLSLAIILATASSILPVYPEVSAESIQRSSGIFHEFIGDFFEPDPYVPFLSTIIAAAYSLIGIILIYYFFEKTQSPEILFIGLFIFSFAFESVRIVVPLARLMRLPSVYLVRSSRILVFGRYFGLFSLFTASIFSAGLKIQKQGNIVIIAAAAALVFALGVLTDGLSWDSALNVKNDFSYTFIMVERGIFGISMASFIISAYTRGSRSYIPIALGALLIYVGRNILLSGDVWISPFLGLFILTLGTLIACIKLHRIYLWL